jgi:hypothetical protein
LLYRAEQLKVECGVSKFAAGLCSSARLSTPAAPVLRRCEYASRQWCDLDRAAPPHREYRVCVLPLNSTLESGISVCFPSLSFILFSFPSRGWAPTSDRAGRLSVPPYPCLCLFLSSKLHSSPLPSLAARLPNAKC